MWAWITVAPIKCLNVVSYSLDPLFKAAMKNDKFLKIEKIPFQKLLVGLLETFSPFSINFQSTLGCTTHVKTFINGDSK